MPVEAVTVTPVSTIRDIEMARGLFHEYVQSLGLDLSFQNVDAEIAGLPGKYAPPGGLLLMVRDGNGAPLGCGALRPLAEPEACEMKRLYVRPAARGQKLGHRLASTLIGQAKAMGYRRMRLDTLGSMAAARALYESLGFSETEPYYNNPVPGTVYLALDL